MENVWTLPWYPSFACGSGYILTNDLIKWLAINHDKLYAYQGEDVSMGIWMTAINPKKIEVNIFLFWNVCINNNFDFNFNFFFLKNIFLNRITDGYVEQKLKLMSI